MLLLAGNALAAEGWIMGVGGEGDSADGGNHFIQSVHFEAGYSVQHDFRDGTFSKGQNRSATFFSANGAVRSLITSTTPK